MRQISAVVITVSDACSIGEREDESGAVLVQLLTELGAEIVAKVIVNDDLDPLAHKLRAYTDLKHVNLIVTTEGTGFGPLRSEIRRPGGRSTSAGTASATVRARRHPNRGRARSPARCPAGIGDPAPGATPGAGAHQAGCLRDAGCLGGATSPHRVRGPGRIHR